MNINGGGSILNYSAFPLMERRLNYFEIIPEYLMELRNKREK
jgi:hypothetical protein